MIVAISGTRRPLEHTDETRVMDVIAKMDGIFHATSWRWGDCPTGVDAFVERLYGRNYSVFWPKPVATPRKRYAAPWNDLGPKAGPLRNRAMIYGEDIDVMSGVNVPRDDVPQADVLIAFPMWGLQNKGTRNAIAHAMNAGVDVVTVWLGR